MNQKHCRGCPHLDINEMSDEMYCKLRDFELIRLRWHKQRPDWCPLVKQKARRMTLEVYEKASDIIKKINSLDEAIADLKFIMSNDTSQWLLEVRPSTSYPSRTINHYGILPEVLQTIYSKHIEEREKLVDELAKL